MAQGQAKLGQRPRPRQRHGRDKWSSGSVGDASSSVPPATRGQHGRLAACSAHAQHPGAHGHAGLASLDRSGTLSRYVTGSDASLSGMQGLGGRKPDRTPEGVSLPALPWKWMERGIEGT